MNYLNQKLITIILVKEIRQHFSFRIYYRYFWQYCTEAFQLQILLWISKVLNY